MDQTRINYGIVLYRLGVPAAAIEAAEETLRSVPPVVHLLANPTVAVTRKHRLIERIFPLELHKFLKKVCDNHCFDGIQDIFTAWRNYRDRQEGILNADLYYVVPPDGGQREAIAEMLKKRHKCTDVRLHLEEKPELLGGFVIRAGSYEYDRSLRGRLERMKQKIARR